MSALGKLIVCTLLAYASAMPKIQHRADGNSGFDLSQFFNNEKFQEYLKENHPAALDYFNSPNQQSPSNAAAIQSDVMEDNSQSQYQVPDWQDYVKSCMSDYQNSFASSSTSTTQTSTATAGSKAGSTNYPWDSYTQGFGGNQPSFSNYAQNGQQYYNNYEKCRKKWESAASQGGYNFPQGGYTPQGFNGFSPSSFNWPSSSNAAPTSSPASASS